MYFKVALLCCIIVSISLFEKVLLSIVTLQLVQYCSVATGTERWFSTPFTLACGLHIFVQVPCNFVIVNRQTCASNMQATCSCFCYKRVEISTLLFIFVIPGGYAAHAWRVGGHEDAGGDGGSLRVGEVAPSAGDGRGQTAVVCWLRPAPRSDAPEPR